MIKVLLFTNVKEKIGKDYLEWQGSGLTVAEVKEQLIQEFQLENELQAVMIAVNEEFVDASYTLEEGDTIAFIPPVSGG